MSVEDYLAGLPADVQELVQGVRSACHAALPGAAEGIRYGMPTLLVDGRPLVHFAAWKHHLGLYPLPADRRRLPELAAYDTGRGTARFPLDQPIPYVLVTRLVEQLARERRPAAPGVAEGGVADGGGADGGGAEGGAGPD